MIKDYVYFDLETMHSANDVGGWNNKGDMRMSVGVTYSSKSNEYIAYPEKKVEDLIKQLASADLVIGYNHISFDYPVLEGYHLFSLADKCISLDLMVSIEEKIGHRIKLESVASATLGAGKTAQGLDAIRWWREGKYREVAEYCCYDVKVTKLVHEFGAKNGYIKYDDKSSDFVTLRTISSDLAEFKPPSILRGLSTPALETLSIVAYEQPVTKLKVSEIRGVESESSLKTLESRGLIEKSGVLDIPGNPNLFVTTNLFLEKMNISKIEELPLLGDYFSNIEEE